MASRTRIIAADGRELIGYVDRWSAAPGDVVRLLASTTEPTVDVSLVRLRHGDRNPAGPGFLATAVPSAVDGAYPGRSQGIRSGSFAVIDSAWPARTLGVWVWPTTPDLGADQVVLASDGLTVRLGPDGRVGASLGTAAVWSSSRLVRERWTHVAVVIGPGELTLVVDDGVAALPVSSPRPVAGTLLLAGAPDGGQTFNGRLEDPWAAPQALTVHEVRAVAAGTRHPDQTWDLRRARLVNAPTLAVTGHRWKDTTTDPRHAPDEYRAVHFHRDDLEDAGWEPTAALTIPADLASGVYAFALRAGDLDDHVPFVVRPPSGRASGAVGFLLPTLTYQVYGNDQRVHRAGAAQPADGWEGLDPADRWLLAHPEAGRSAYDCHGDGHGVALVSQRRPTPSFRGDFRRWNLGAPERFGSDLYIVDWLDEIGADWDAFTDHDLHAEGRALLDRYPVIVTGTHPEYVTGRILDALAGYLGAGGRVMYLGGNGFYWVTSIDPERPHIAEVRRGINGTRTWSSRPGEGFHQTTGEPGGLWRHRGRAPNSIVGVGFAAQCDTPERAPGYRRTAASYEPAHAWIFDGTDEGELIGEYGLCLGGAAGYEIDRHAPEFGSPDASVVLATSAGRHADGYLLAVEEMEATVAEVTGPASPQVRADLTYVPYPNGGAVFSVGSCSWCGSLSHDGYDNDIARITGNVLRRFLQASLSRPRPRS